MVKAKLTKQGVRDLGHSRKPTPREIPPKVKQWTCPHLNTRMLPINDYFEYEICNDCQTTVDTHYTGLR